MPPNDEMQRASRGQDGGPPLISVLDRQRIESMDGIERTLLSKDHQIRVDIFRRPSGTFGFRVYSWHVAPQPEGPHWCMRGGYSECVTGSAEDAEREARERVAGMADASVVM